MSADNYYRICRHPNGGFAAVMGFMSDDHEAEPTASHPIYATIREAYDAADRDPLIEYGIRVDRDLLGGDQS